MDESFLKEISPTEMPTATVIFLTPTSNDPMLSFTLEPIVAKLNKRVHNNQLANLLGTIASMVPNTTIKVMSSIGVKIFNQLQSTDDLKEDILLAKIEHKLLASELKNLHAKIKEVSTNIRTIQKDEGVCKRTLAMATVAATGEIVSLVADPDHVFLKNPISSTPHFTLFCRVFRIFLESTHEMSSIEVDKRLQNEFRRQMTSLQTATEQYAAGAIRARLEGISRRTHLLTTYDDGNALAQYSIVDFVAGIRTPLVSKDQLFDVTKYRNNVWKAYQDYFAKVHLLFKI